ncbi:phage tail tape measure protein [Megasphaera paucivorans]|uniref:Phage tail tape measure protein, TP901 family, core region n=1 Tax=Megasphaera paucivorans TaxID=349095 RepID=A0A1G9QVQ2_9FIRM|nr:phage tail tape measure protein [Megasphaera paucivorans]SDM15096.1 phage tail tape measure protein, TP901 family, core region [Megasphaera paucivorans]
MNGYVLSATLELKDKLTGTVNEARKGLKNLKESAQGVPSSLQSAATSFEKAGASAKVLTSGIDAAKKSLSGIKGTYTTRLEAKDEATSKIKLVQEELNQFKGKTYTAMVNVKNNLSKDGGVGGKLSNGMSNMAGGMLMGTSLQMAGAAGIGYGIYDTIKTYMDFEAQLSEIKALTGLDATAMDQVKEKAMELGQATVFGNTEVAKGMAELLKAGVDVKDVLGDASEAALNLAVAGDIALPDAAEIMSTAMNAFKVDDATHAADTLAGAANASATSVGELKYSLAACSAVAAGAGMSFDDTNTALAVFAQNGLKGSDAGTSLKTMLSNLVPKGKTAIAAFEKLNLLTESGSSAFFDEAGNMKSLADIAGLLNNRMKDMTKEEQLSTLYDMFGSDAIRGGMILLREGAGGVTQMFKEMGKVTAKDVAITRMDNLKGDIEQLSGAWENFQDTLMDSHNSFGLRGFITELTDVVQYAGALIKDGFDFSDIFKLAGKGINDLKNKFLQFDGIGSMLSGGVLAFGLYKITKLVLKAKDAVTSIGQGTKIPGGMGDTTGITKDMVINARTVIVNGNNSSTVPNSPIPTDTTTPNNGGLSKLSRFTKWMGRLAVPLAIAGGIYDIVTAQEGQRGAAAGGAIGGVGGMLVGAKLGTAAGASIGSIVPGVGTAVGGAVGGLVGGTAGYIGGSNVGKNFADNIDFSGIKEKWSTAIGEMERDFVNAGPRFQSGWAEITENIRAGWDNNTAYLRAKQEEFSTQIQTTWNDISTGAQSAMDSIRSAFSDASANAESSWSNVVGWFDTNVWGPLKEKASNAWDSIKSGISGISLPSFGVHLPGMKWNATGSSYFEGGLTHINEHGGEIVDLPQGSRIYPAATTQRIIAKRVSKYRNSNTGGVLVTGNTFIIREEDDIDKVAHQLFQLMDQANLNYGGGY